ncbi:DNA-directed RNA polymerase subunit N [Candidatus Gugararchaeum adminiculabundum]|nr:DNA-directed RNA polymerase subunit N [Candidatus Gugararchaeum adminiculabundum]
MLFPIRCFTCGAVIADKYEDFVEKTREGEDKGKVLDKLGVERYCCRRMFLTHVNVIDDISLCDRF